MIRRFFRAPRLVLSVATIGLAQVLAGIGLLLPGWFGVQPPAPELPRADRRVVHRRAAALRWQRRGRARSSFRSRSSASRSSSAPVSAWRCAPAPTTSTGPRSSASRCGGCTPWSWAIAALLAFLAVFLRAGIVGLSLGTVLGPSLLLPALAAAVIGRMERLPTIAAAAIALGIVEQSVIWGWNQPSDVYPVLFVVVVAAVWLTPAGAGLRGRLEPSTWRAVREPRPVPGELARLPEVRITRALLLVGGRRRPRARAASCSPRAAPTSRRWRWSTGSSRCRSSSSPVGPARSASGRWRSWRSALRSVASLTARLGWDLALGLLGAGVVGAGVAALIGLPVLRRRGLTLAVITLAFGLATTAWLLEPRIFGEGTRFDWLPPRASNDRDLFGVIDVDTESRYYLLCLVALALVIVGRRRHPSQPHRTCARRDPRERACRERVRREPAHHHAAGVRDVGVPRRVRGRARSCTSRTGSSSTRTARARASWCSRWSSIGGLGSVPGALLGALFVRGVTWWLPVEWQILATGAGMLVVLLVFRGGLGAALADARDACSAGSWRDGAASRVPALTGTVEAPTGPPAAGVVALDAATGLLRVRAALGRARRRARARRHRPRRRCRRDRRARSAPTAPASRRCSTRSQACTARAQGSSRIDGIDTTRTRAEHARGRSAWPRRRPSTGCSRPSACARTSVSPRGECATAPRHARALADALELFPRLEERATQRAGDLSGGEQHMLTLAMALVAAPLTAPGRRARPRSLPRGHPAGARAAAIPPRRRRRSGRRGAVDRPRDRARGPRGLPRPRHRRLPRRPCGPARTPRPRPGHVPRRRGVSGASRDRAWIARPRRPRRHSSCATSACASAASTRSPGSRSPSHAARSSA